MLNSSIYTKEGVGMTGGEISSIDDLIVSPL